MRRARVSQSYLLCRVTLIPRDNNLQANLLARQARLHVPLFSYVCRHLWIPSKFMILHLMTKETKKKH